MSHNTIHTFKYYFTIIFFVFNKKIIMKNQRHKLKHTLSLEEKKKKKTRQVMAKGIGSGLNPFLWLKGFDWVKV